MGSWCSVCKRRANAITTIDGETLNVEEDFCAFDEESDSLLLGDYEDSLEEEEELVITKPVLEPPKAVGKSKGMKYTKLPTHSKCSKNKR